MRRYLYLCLLLPLLITSCSLFQAPQFKGVSNFKLNELTADHTDIDLALVIANPNGFALALKSLNVTVTDTLQNRLGDVTMLQPLEIPKHDSDTLFLEIELNTRQVAKLVSHSSDKVKFIVHAVAVAHVFGITKQISKDLPEQINITEILLKALPQIPTEFQAPSINISKKKQTQKGNFTSGEKKSDTAKATPELFKVLKAGISDMGFKETELTIRFMLLNPFGLTFTLKDFPAQVSVNGTLAGKGRLAKPLVFDEDVYSQEGEIVCTLNNWNSLKLGTNALFKKGLDYVVQGNLQAEGLGVCINKPFAVKGHVDIGKTAGQ